MFVSCMTVCLFVNYGDIYKFKVQDSKVMVDEGKAWFASLKEIQNE